MFIYLIVTGVLDPTSPTHPPPAHNKLKTVYHYTVPMKEILLSPIVEHRLIVCYLSASFHKSVIINRI